MELMQNRMRLIDIDEEFDPVKLETRYRLYFVILEEEIPEDENIIYFETFEYIVDEEVVEEYELNEIYELTMSLEQKSGAQGAS